MAQLSDKKRVRRWIVFNSANVSVRIVVAYQRDAAYESAGVCDLVYFIRGCYQQVAVGERLHVENLIIHINCGPGIGLAQCEPGQ